LEEKLDTGLEGTIIVRNVFGELNSKISVWQIS